MSTKNHDTTQTTETLTQKNLKAAYFDEFVIACPYFTSEYDVNNNYGCMHPAQDEIDTDTITGIERGTCHCYSCPL